MLWSFFLFCLCVETIGRAFFLIFFDSVGWTAEVLGRSDRRTKGPRHRVLRRRYRSEYRNTQQQRERERERRLLFWRAAPLSLSLSLVLRKRINRKEKGDAGVGVCVCGVGGWETKEGGGGCVREEPERGVGWGGGVVGRAQID